MSDFGEQFARRAITALDDKGAAESLCPACSHKEWAVNQDTIALLNHLGDEIQLKTATGMSTVAFVCKHCGFVRLHSALRLFA